MTVYIYIYCGNYYLVFCRVAGRWWRTPRVGWAPMPTRTGSGWDTTMLKPSNARNVVLNIRKQAEMNQNSHSLISAIFSWNFTTSPVWVYPWKQIEMNQNSYFGKFIDQRHLWLKTTTSPVWVYPWAGAGRRHGLGPGSGRLQEHLRRGSPSAHERHQGRPRARRGQVQSEDRRADHRQDPAAGGQASRDDDNPSSIDDNSCPRYNAIVASYNSHTNPNSALSLERAELGFLNWFSQIPNWLGWGERVKRGVVRSKDMGIPQIYNLNFSWRHQNPQLPPFFKSSKCHILWTSEEPWVDFFYSSWNVQ